MKSKMERTELLTVEDQGTELYPKKKKTPKSQQGHQAMAHRSMCHYVPYATKSSYLCFLFLDSDSDLLVKNK